MDTSANRAIAIGRDIEYQLVDAGGSGLIIAKKLVKSVMEKSEIKEYSVICNINNEAFENIILNHPFYDITVPLIKADHVTDENGTGAVHYTGAWYR